MRVAGKEVRRRGLLKRRRPLPQGETMWPTHNTSYVQRLLTDDMTDPSSVVMQPAWWAPLGVDNGKGFKFKSRCFLVRHGFSRSSTGILIIITENYNQAIEIVIETNHRVYCQLLGSVRSVASMACGDCWVDIEALLTVFFYDLNSKWSKVDLST